MNSTMMLLALLSVASALFVWYKVRHPGRPRPWSNVYRYGDIGVSLTFAVFFLVLAFVLR